MVELLGMKRILVWATMLLLGIAFGVTGWNEYRSAAASLTAKKAELLESERIVQQIKSSATKPRLASLNLESLQQISHRVAEAANRASVPTNRLASITPYPPVRILDSAYQQRATELNLKAVTLPTLAAFASNLQDDASGLVIRDVNLSPMLANSSIETGHDGLERWDVRLTLTQMIYSPTSR